MYSKLISSLLRRLRKSSKSDHSPRQCNSQPGPATERQSLHISHLPPDGGEDGHDGSSAAVSQPAKPPAGPALLLDDCQMFDPAPCPGFFTHQSVYEEPDMRQQFTLSWNVKYLGSFPISNTTPDHVSSRLEKFQTAPTASPVTLSISLSGIQIHNKKNLLMAHSLRRVCSVIGRAALRQVAYTALEAAGQTYRRQCHVFETDTIHQVEEIESVLGNAFQIAVVTRSSTPLRPKSMSATPLSLSANLKTERRTTSTAFMARFLGKEKNIVEEKPKIKRRPVSAVLSSALHRFSSTSAACNKRMSSVDTLRKDHWREDYIQRKEASPVPEEPIPSSEKGHTKPALEYDEKLDEWIYPIDEALQAQLENVNYFVKLPSRELLARNLLSQLEGAFVVRYSESKRKCLALSVRVPHTHNPACISHYLIIRNQHGYRIKVVSGDKHFPSLQMLITHHSVMREMLPVALNFIQWNPSDWLENGEVPPLAPEKRHSHTATIAKHSDTDENRNSRCCHDREHRKEDLATPKRRPRIHEENYRRSRIIDNI